MLLYVMVMVNKDIRGLILKDEWIINFVIFIYLVCMFYLLWMGKMLKDYYYLILLCGLKLLIKDGRLVGELSKKKLRIE